MDERVQRTVDYLEATEHRSVPLDRLSSRVGLRPSRLQHLFKRDLSLSIRDFVRLRRLERAASLLLRTDDRVSEVLHKVGFSDASNFSRAFRREFGMSPLEYRRSGRGTDLA